MKRILIIILFLHFNLLTIAQSISFEKYLSGYGSFEITDVIENNKQYYLLCNQSYDTFDQYTSFILKVNKEGDSVIYYDLNIPFHYVLRSFTKSINGGFCFVGGIDSLESNFNSSRDGLWINTDTNLNILKVRSYKMSHKNKWL